MLKYKSYKDPYFIELQAKKSISLTDLSLDHELVGILDWLILLMASRS